jgi:hypothetical protein
VELCDALFLIAETVEVYLTEMEFADKRSKDVDVFRRVNFNIKTSDKK